MPRTTAAAVLKVLGETDDAIDLDPFIEAAEALVDDIVAPSLSSITRQEQVERWLAAHFYSIPNPQAQSQQARGVGQALFGKVNMGLQQTRFGDQAITLDSSGSLAAWNSNVVKGTAGKRSIAYLGTAQPRHDKVPARSYWNYCC